MKIFRIDKYSNENKLIDDCKAEKHSAQKYLFEKYSSKFLSISNRYIENDKEAEDILMESFMKIFSKISSYNYKGSFEGWMKRILVNECISYLRKKKNIFISIEDKEMQIVDENSLENEKNIRVNYLMKILKNLPDGYRSVFNLYVLEGYKHKEIGLLLGISENTSKTQLLKAKSLINKNLKNLPLETEMQIEEYDIVKYLSINHG